MDVVCRRGAVFCYIGSNAAPLLPSWPEILRGTVHNWLISQHQCIGYHHVANQIKAETQGILAMCHLLL